MRKQRETKTKEQRENRLQENREQKRKKKQTETKEQRERRLKKQRESDRRARREESLTKESGNGKTSLDQLVVNFHKLVVTGPTFVCICCDQLWYRHNLVRGATDNEAVLKCIGTSEQCCTSHQLVCCTCYNHLKLNKVPPCAVQNKISFPHKPEHLD